MRFNKLDKWKVELSKCDAKAWADLEDAVRRVNEGAREKFRPR